MKKILLAFDGNQFSNGAFSFARELNKLQPILLTAVFVPQLDLADMWSYGTAMTGVAALPIEVQPVETEKVKKHMDHFVELCRKHQIPYRIHEPYYGPALSELRKETRFADALIIGSEGFYSSEGSLSEY